MIPGDVSRMSLVDHRPHHVEGALGVSVVFSVAYPPDDIVRASFCKQPVTGIDDAVENAYIRAVQRHYITIDLRTSSKTVETFGAKTFSKPVTLETTTLL